MHVAETVLPIGDKRKPKADRRVRMAQAQKDKIASKTHVVAERFQRHTLELFAHGAPPITFSYSRRISAPTHTNHTVSIMRRFAITWLTVATAMAAALSFG